MTTRETPAQDNEEERSMRRGVATARRALRDLGVAAASSRRPLFSSRAPFSNRTVLGWRGRRRDCPGRGTPNGAPVPAAGGARRIAAASVLVAAVAVAAASCGGSAAATSVPAATSTTSAAGTLTPAVAGTVVQSYLTAEKVATADRNEMLALSLDGYAAYTLTTAAYHIAGHGALPAYSYGKPTLYVPKLTTFPYWFMALVPRRPAGGGAASNELMVFDQANATSAWDLAGSATLPSGTALPTITTKGGYATALPTTDSALLVSPNVVGAAQAAVVDDGPASRAATIVASGPQTTGLYSSNASAVGAAAARHETYEWSMTGTSDPSFALATSGGGALVFYTMSMTTTTEVVGASTSPKSSNRGTTPTIPMPTGAVRALLPLHQAPITHSLTVDETLPFAAVVPSAHAHGGEIKVIGAGGGPTSVDAH